MAWLRYELAIIGLLQCLGETASSQAVPYVGERLRVWTHVPGQVAEGYYVGADRDSLALRPIHAESIERFSWTELRLIERRLDLQRHPLIGGLLGAVVGGGVGAYLGSHSTIGSVSRTATGAVWGIVGAAAIGGLGALIGYSAVTERWQKLHTWVESDRTMFGVRLAF